MSRKIAFAAAVALAAMAALVAGLNSLQAQSEAPAPPSSAPASSLMTLTERDAFDAAVRDALRRNPDIVVEAINAYQAQEEMRRQVEASAAIAERHDELYNNPAVPDTGPADAAVTLVEFFDYECGYCKRMWPDLQRVMNEVEGVRVVFFEFPILSETSNAAARAALAADQQGKYVEMHDALMRFNGRKSDEVIERLARRIGLDIDQLKADMASPEIEALLAQKRQLAQALSIRGTPALILDGQLMPGAVPYDQLVEMIETVKDSKT